MVSKNTIISYLQLLTDFGEDEIIIPEGHKFFKKPKTVAVAPKGKIGQLEKLRQQYLTCRACPLGESRINFVFGTGNPDTRLMFVGEGPGFDEDHKGEPFIGRAGKLLNDMIRGMTLDRSNVYIANIVKCHPMKDPSDPELRGNDRPPVEAEARKCIHILHQQIQIIHPVLIIALGAVASRYLLPVEFKALGDVRGRFFEYITPDGKVTDTKIMPTYHPAALLRDPRNKVPAWEDLKIAMRELNLIIPKGYA
ncbi:MAG: uracil-DNA glycosylase [Elusimicrobiota bacterium]